MKSTVIPNPFILTPESDLLELGKGCNAVYVCPKDESGQRKGPLVAYAGKDYKERNLVGDIYFNFRRIESRPRIVGVFAQTVCWKLYELELIDSFDTVCGIPQGGRTFGQMLALVADKRFVYAEKTPKETKVGKKQEYTWDLSQFEFEPGERVAVAEDVFNNFQNTDNVLAAIAAFGVEIVLLVGVLNRSLAYDTTYTPKSGSSVRSLPVVASIRKSYPEYRQDDSEVADDIAAGNVEFKVKKNWACLCTAMEMFVCPEGAAVGKGKEYPARKNSAYDLLDRSSC